MNVIIMGCSRVGGRLAMLLDEEGHKVSVIDVDPYSFRWLPPTFKGSALIGNGLDEETMLKAGIENADVFISTTQGDNRNVMAAQIAKHIYNVPRVASRIYDPIREEMYNKLGIETISPTKVGADMLKNLIEEQ
ncbi:potassium channel family protein [Chloroflexota bacterium]